MDTPVHIEEGAGAQSVDRALSLLSAIARRGGADVPMATLLAETGLSRPTVRRLLLALIRAGMIEQDPHSRAYSLGAESYLIGMVAQRRFSLLDIAIDSLLTLSEKSGDSSFLTVRRCTRTICLHREEGAYPVRTQALQAGDRHPVGIGAAGIAILAALAGETCETIRRKIAPELAERYPAYTPEVLDEALAVARARGWALNPGLNFANSWGMGVALRDPTGDVVGALSLAALDTRMQPERQPELAALLTGEAARVEERLRESMRPRTGKRET